MKQGRNGIITYMLYPRKKEKQDGKWCQTSLLVKFHAFSMSDPFTFVCLISDVCLESLPNYICANIPTSCKIATVLVTE